MYVRIAGGFGQAPMLRGTFAGTLGDGPTFPPEIQKFLERVRKRPQDYEAVLLISAFHLEPFSSVQLQKVMAASFENDGKDTIEEAKAIQGRVIQALEVICKEHLKDHDFRKLFDKEKQLIPVVAKVFQETIKKIETQGWVEKILLEALLAETPLLLLSKSESRSSFISCPLRLPNRFSIVGYRKRITPGWAKLSN